GHRLSARRIWSAWFSALAGVEKIEILHPPPQRATPHACPRLRSTSQPTASASRSAFLISFFGCLSADTTAGVGVCQQLSHWKTRQHYRRTGGGQSFSPLPGGSE